MHQPQTARDKVLWVLTFSDDPLDRNSLHARTRLKISKLKDPEQSRARGQDKAVSGGSSYGVDQAEQRTAFLCRKEKEEIKEGLQLIGRAPLRALWATLLPPLVHHPPSPCQHAPGIHPGAAG